jgi:hypothetical protein
MALNGRRSLTLTEWQSLPLVAEWQAFTLFCCSFLRFAIKQSQTALPLNVIKGVSPNAIKCHLSWRRDEGQSPLPKKLSIFN